METKKMTLVNMQGKLSRAEMKNIMAGDNPEDMGECKDECQTSADCPVNRSCGGGACAGTGAPFKRCNAVP